MSPRQIRMHGSKSRRPPTRSPRSPIRNRMIGFPYPKLMNSNNDVDMGAAIIMCTVEAAERMGVSRDKWVFRTRAPTPTSTHSSHIATPLLERPLWNSAAPWPSTWRASTSTTCRCSICTRASRQQYNSERSHSVSTSRPAVAVSGRGQADSPSAAGPWNNYVMHAIASVVEDLRARPGEYGLTWANGGYATKHAFGVYSTTPPANAFQHGSPQAEVDALPKRNLATRPTLRGRRRSRPTR